MPIRILIVDDEPHIRKVMRLALESSGHEVGEAGTGEEALEMIGATKWDIVLLDERMPGIDGLETLRRLRSSDSEAVVIMVTAFASIELAVDAMKLGAIDFVRKPMSPETLRAAVDNALAKTWGGWPARTSTPTVADEHRVEMWSMNGFRVRHVADGAAETDNTFEVGRGRTGPGRQVVVQFARTVVSAASAEAGRSLDNDRAFWSRVGGIALLRHLWTHAETPAGDRLLIAELSDDVLKAARR